jgi:phosphonate transport system substrate-binding protein
MMKSFARAGAVALMGLLAACGGGDDKGAAAGKTEVNFSILATESSENLMPKWQPFLADMSKATGLEIKPFFADDYAGLIEAMRFNRVQVGWFSNKSGLEAVRRADAEVFAQSTYADGSPGYYATIEVKADGPIKTLDQLLKCDRTVDLGMGDPNSFSGYLVPIVYLFAPRNIDPDRCFKTVVNQNHEANALSVYNGRIDAATNNTTNIKVLNRERPQVVKGLREVWRSPLLGLDPIVYRKDLDPAVKAKMQQFFQDYGRKGTPDEVARARKILAGLEFGLFNKADDSILNQVREVDLTKELFDLRGRADAEAQARRREIEGQLAELRKEGVSPTAPTTKAGE